MRVAEKWSYAIDYDDDEMIFNGKACLKQQQLYKMVIFIRADVINEK